MIFLTKKAYKNKIEAAQQEAMTELLYRLCDSNLLVHDQHSSLPQCTHYSLDKNNRGMIRRFACMVVETQVYKPWWNFWAKKG